MLLQLLLIGPLLRLVKPLLKKGLLVFAFIWGIGIAGSVASIAIYKIGKAFDHFLAWL